MNANSNRPLVTLIMPTYNQEKYVRDAIRGAFAQTYEPLQIVISDDCSSDSTWEIVLDEINAYTKHGGIHKNLFLNRNDENIGLMRHFQLALTFCRGEIVVCNAGDDISMPNRIEKIVKAWLDSDRKATVIAHAWREMGVDGRCYGAGGPYEATAPLGAATAYAAWAIKGFPKIEVHDSFEDHVYTFRALCRGDYLKLNDALICYRIGSGVSTRGGVRRRRDTISRRSIKSAEQSKIDIEFCRMNLDPARVKIVEAMIDWEFSHYGAENNLFEGRTFWRRLNGFCGLNKKNDWHVSPLRKLLVYGPYVIAPRFGDSILSFYSILKRWLHKWL